MKTRTLRGQLTDTNVKQIIVDDGRLNYGYIVREFYAWVNGSSADGVYVVLGKEYDMVAGGDASDGRQIAWAGNAWSTGTGLTAGAFSVIDPDHVVIQDLYIQRINPSDVANYLIVLEERQLTDDESILQLIKERSQDDER